MREHKKKKYRSVPPRDDRYMGLAFFISSFSKDPDTQNGSIIVDDENYVLGWGYNGPPRQINDDDVDWGRPFKYPYMKHAEQNAISRAREGKRSVKDSTIYITGFPCSVCMLDIVDAGISKVIYFPYKPKDKKSSMNKDKEISEEIASNGNVTLEEFEGNLNWMRDHIETMYEIGIFG